MRPQPKSSLFFSSICTLFGASALHASDYAMSPVQFPSSFNVNAMTQIGTVYDRPSVRQFTSTRIAASSRPEALVFAPSTARRKVNLANFVAKSRKVDPTGAAKMAQLFASTDVIAALGQDLQRYSLRTDNVADAYAVYWVQAWQAANGDTSDPDRATMQAVKQQSARAIASTSEFAAATDAGKQEMAEAMLLQAMMISASVDTYKNDPDMMRQVGAAVRKGAKASGLDLDAMTLTDKGFVPARKTGAVETSEETQLADAQATKAAGDDNPPYLLIAAAGGAGIGGVFMLGKMMGRRE